MTTATTTALQTEPQSRERATSVAASYLNRLPRLAFLWAPSLAAIIYFGLLATDRYVSDAQFVVRSAAQPAGGSGLGALLQSTGLGVAQEEVFSVQSFLTSRDATVKLLEKLPVKEIYGHADADFLARYPSIVFGDTIVELHEYLSWMISTTYNSTSGITTLHVEAFKPEDAHAIAALLLDLGEEMVNQMNTRIHRDAIRVAEAEVKRNEERLIAAQIEITRFQNSELLIDPAGSSIVVTTLIARLSAELAQVETQAREMGSYSPDNPQLPSLQRRGEALRNQILKERRKISADSDGLAGKLALYERLIINKELAKQTLTAAVNSLEDAQNEARRQQLYLERVVEPFAADFPMAPNRVRLVATAVGLNLILLLVGWLVFSGLREHAAETS